MTRALALDTQLLVYSVLDGHPAAGVCEQFIRAQSGWFTSPVILLECQAILTKAYNVPAALVGQKLATIASAPIEVVDLDLKTTLEALSNAHSLNVDIPDAVLLCLTRGVGAKVMATDDQQLGKACASLGIRHVSPITPILRQQIGAWEHANLPVKGLPRVLATIHDWLRRLHPQAAVDFWSHSGGGSHLP